MRYHLKICNKPGFTTQFTRHFWTTPYYVPVLVLGRWCEWVVGCRGGQNHEERFALVSFTLNVLVDEVLRFSANDVGQVIVFVHFTVSLSLAIHRQVVVVVPVGAF